MDLEKWETQVRKGLLLFLILLVLKKGECYGYDLIRKIKRTISLTISEGTIYPILTRLKKSEFVVARWEEPTTGVPRKYYSITEAGLEALEQMQSSWLSVTSAITKLVDQA